MEFNAGFSFTGTRKSPLNMLWPRELTKPAPARGRGAGSREAVHLDVFCIDIKGLLALTPR